MSAYVDGSFATVAVRWYF